MKLPDGWEVHHLGDLFSSRKEKGIEGLHTLSVTINNGLVERSSIERKTDTNLSPQEHLLIRKGDLAYNMMRMWQGASGLADYDGLVSPAYVVLSPTDRIDSKFAFYWFKSPRMIYLFWAYSYGLTGDRLRLYFNDFTKIKYALPPVPEQKVIADLLSTWDEAIEKTEKLILAKEKQLSQMSRWLLFGHKRLKNKQNELVDGHFFRYPSDWKLVKIENVAKEVSLRNGESEKPVLSCSKHDGFVNSLDYFGKQVFSSDTSNYKVVKKGQFGYPSNHVEEGSIGLLDHCEIGIVSPIYVVFEATKEKVHSPYLFKLLKTDVYRHIFQVSTSSSVNRRGSLRWSDFSKIKVLLPPLEEQKQIAEILSPAKHEIDLLKQMAEKYKTQKRGLMQKMLTGEWRVMPDIVKSYEENTKHQSAPEKWHSVGAEFNEHCE